MRRARLVLTVVLASLAAAYCVQKLLVEHFHAPRAWVWLGWFALTGLLVALFRSHWSNEDRRP